MGVYDEFFTYGEYVKGNLYTVFRGIITDFGLLGSLFLLLYLVFSVIFAIGGFCVEMAAHLLFYFLLFCRYKLSDLYH